jgi:hypothetical protein
VNEARHVVLRQLAEAYDHFCEQEQVLVAEGRYSDAQEMHGYALRILTAYKAETDDPTPQRPCECHVCSVVYVKGTR